MSLEFIYVIRPKRADFVQTITDEERRIMSEHFDYLQDLTDKGVMLLVGRCEDASFGIAVFRADSAAEAEQIMLNDPAIARGVMSYELKPFRVALRLIGE